MKKALKRLLIALAFASIVFQSCDPALGSNKKTISITDVGFSIDNLPSDWWSINATNKPSLSYDFGIKLAGSATVADIEYARVNLPGDTGYFWNFDLTEYDSAKNYFYSNDRWLTDHDKELPIGTLTAVIKLKDGTIAEYPFTMGVPGSTSPGIYEYVFNSDDAASSSFYYSVPAIQRATIASFAQVNGRVVASFVIHGSNVHNGWAWFYDASGQYIGWSRQFLDPTSGSTTSKLTNSTFNTGDGQSNTLTLAPADIFDSNGEAITAMTLSAIQKCRIVVIDGSQYVPTGHYSYYDYRAISAFSN